MPRPKSRTHHSKPSPDQRLDILRAEIDTIDDALHDLIVKRVTVVEQIGAIKNGSKSGAGPILRPGREATVIRRLVAAHRGRFPGKALVCLWREIIGACGQMQKPFSAGILAPVGQDRPMSLARDHFGSTTPLVRLASASACVRALAEGVVDLIVLPTPGPGEAAPWWPMLMADDGRTPRIVALLPFAAEGGSDRAFVLAPWNRDISADEISVVGLRLDGRRSGGKVVAAFANAGFPHATLLAGADADLQNPAYLVEIDGVVASDDARFSALASHLGAEFVEAHVVGGYARPLDMAPR
jgi:chorismate mutase-like protein